MQDQVYKEARPASGITVDDLRRALLNGGDISFLTPVLKRALKDPPVAVAPTLGIPLALPDPALLLAGDERLKALLRSWQNEAELPGGPVENVELMLLPLPPHGRNAAGCLARFIDGLKPDVLALDSAPNETASALLYTLSLPAAVGLTVYAEMRLKGDGKPYGSRVFYPGSLDETAVLEGLVRNIPVVPVGKPYAAGNPALDTADEDVVDEAMSGIAIKEAYEKADELLENSPYAKLLADAAERAGSALENSVSVHINHKLAREAKYAASRLADLASVLNRPDKKTRVLAVIDMKHYPAVKHCAGLILSGAREDNYVRPENPAPGQILMLGRHAAANAADIALAEKSPLQALFEQGLTEWSAGIQKEHLSEDAADRYIASTMERLRTHPLVLKGASVRGSLGFKEVTGSLAALDTGVTRETLAKAAFITLPPRIRLKPGVKETRESVVADTVKEALYGIEFYRTVYDITGSAEWLSPDDINRLLEEMSRKKKPGEEPAGDKNYEALLKALAAQKLIRRDIEGNLNLTSQSIERLLKALEARAREGKISEGSYNREKARLEEMLASAREGEREIPAKELAAMVMDFMDMVDRGFEKEWGRDINPLRVFLFYRLLVDDGNGLSPWQSDALELKRRLNMLEKRGILRVPFGAAERSLSGLGLLSLLEYLEPRNVELKKLRMSLSQGKSALAERTEEVRHYTAADTYRDISFRHTLKEIARQKKELHSVRRGDFRVFTRPEKWQHTDTVLCLDTSGSMVEHRKLIYARLAAASIAMAAKESEDRVAVVSFEDAGRTSVPFSDDNNSLVNDYLTALAPNGATNIGDGIKCAVDLLTRDPNHNKRRIYLITDGEPNAISEKALNRLKGKTPGDLTEEAALVEVRRAAARGITLSVIFLAAEKRKGDTFVKNLARAGKGRVIVLNCRDEEPVLKDTVFQPADYVEYRYGY